MIVRVSVRLINEGTENNAEVVVLINGGAESEVPIIVVTPSVARYLELNLNDMDEMLNWRQEPRVITYQEVPC